MSGEFNINLRKYPISSTEKASIIKDLVKIINNFEKEYKAEFILKDLIENEYQSVINQRIEEIRKSRPEISYEILNEDKILQNLSKKKKDKAKIFELIDMVAEKHYIFHFDFFLKLFRIILDIRDFILGGTIENIANTHGFSPKYVKSIAKLVFQVQNKKYLYEQRFFHRKYIRQILISIADEVKSGKITRRCFSNLLNPYLQEQLMEYQKIRERENSKFITIGLDFQFIQRLVKLSYLTSENILKSSIETLTISDLLIMCSKINKNHEILKYIIYTLMNKPDDELSISKITGKNVEFIQECEKIIKYEKVILEK